MKHATPAAGAVSIPAASGDHVTAVPPQSSEGLTLILPAYNEAPAIAQSLADAVAALSEMAIPFEVLVVDDGSSDGTADVARASGHDPNRVRVVSLVRNTGYGAALRHGFREARYSLVAFTDADGQFDLRELSGLLLLARRFDLVCGYRIDRQDPWMRKFYSRGYNLLVQTLLGTRVRDCDCALKIFRRDQVLSLDLESNGFFINAEILAKARMAGQSVSEVGVNHFPRLRGVSKVSIRHILPVLCTLLKFWWSKVQFSRPAPDFKIPMNGRARWAAGILLAAVSGLLLLPNLSYPLIDPDESRYAEISREMLESGDFVVPTRFGKPYLDKPPLLYWLTATSFRAFGVSEASARLVPALSAILTVVITYALGARLVGYAAAWLGSLSMLSCFGFLISGRFVFIDTVLTCCTTVSLLTGYLASREAKVKLWLWSLSAAACALGILAKGPVALVLCVPPLVASRWLTGLPAIRARNWALFGTIAGAVTLPWFLLMNERQSGFLVDFIWTHHVNRFVSGLTHTEPWWYYIPVLLVGMLPSSVLLPAIVIFLVDRRNATRSWRSWNVGFLVLSAAWTIGLFSCSSCKLPPYLLPAVPCGCLIIGRGVEAILSGRTDQPYLRFVRERSPHHLILMLLAAALICSVIDVAGLDGLASGRLSHWLVLDGIAGALAAASLSGRFLARGLAPWRATGFLTVLCMGMAMLDFYPGIATMRSKVSPIVEICRAEIDRSAPIVCYSLAQEADSMAFHLGARQVQNFEWLQVMDAVSALNQAPESIVLANANEVELLRSRLPPDLTLAELGRYEHIYVGVCTSSARVASRQ
jgi:dolichol-phosphate mannosyltransferase